MSLSQSNQFSMLPKELFFQIFNFCDLGFIEIKVINTIFYKHITLYLKKLRRESSREQFKLFAMHDPFSQLPFEKKKIDSLFKEFKTNDSSFQFLSTKNNKDKINQSIKLLALQLNDSDFADLFSKRRFVHLSLKEVEFDGENVLHFRKDDTFDHLCKRIHWHHHILDRLNTQQCLTLFLDLVSYFFKESRINDIDIRDMHLENQNYHLVRKIFFHQLISLMSRVIEKIKLCKIDKLTLKDTDIEKRLSKTISELTQATSNLIDLDKAKRQRNSLEYITSFNVIDWISPVVNIKSLHYLQFIYEIQGLSLNAQNSLILENSINPLLNLIEIQLRSQSSILTEKDAEMLCMFFEMSWCLLSSDLREKWLALIKTHLDQLKDNDEQKDHNEQEFMRLAQWSFSIAIWAAIKKSGVTVSDSIKSNWINNILLSDKDFGRLINLSVGNDGYDYLIHKNNPDLSFLSVMLYFNSLLEQDKIKNQIENLFNCYNAKKSYVMIDELEKFVSQALLPLIFLFPETKRNLFISQLIQLIQNGLLNITNTIQYDLDQQAMMNQFTMSNIESVIENCFSSDARWLSHVLKSLFLSRENRLFNLEYILNHRLSSQTFNNVISSYFSMENDFNHINQILLSLYLSKEFNTIWNIKISNIPPNNDYPHRQILINIEKYFGKGKKEEFVANLFNQTITNIKNTSNYVRFRYLLQCFLFDYLLFLLQKDVYPQFARDKFLLKTFWEDFFSFRDITINELSPSNSIEYFMFMTSHTHFEFTKKDWENMFQIIQSIAQANDSNLKSDLTPFILRVKPFIQKKIVCLTIPINKKAATSSLGLYGQNSNKKTLEEKEKKERVTTLTTITQTTTTTTTTTTTITKPSEHAKYTTYKRM